MDSTTIVKRGSCPPARLPSIGSSANYSAAFRLEMNPASPVELVLVDEMARRAAQMHQLETARESLLREGQSALTDVLAAAGDAAATTAREIAGLSVLGSERHELLFRQGVGAARSFVRALHELREHRAASQSHGVHDWLAPDPRFASERGCCAYLTRRYADGTCACRRCGAVTAGCFVAARKCWQCGACGAQTGIRSGTCMESSAIALTKWFAAIRIVLLQPTIPVVELSATLQITRHQTVGNMLKKIRAATGSDQASQLLAGLDQLYLGFE
jgi:hypothetical protein